MQASRPQVQKTDLSKRRIVAFATHGLIPGDLPDLEQPALALSAHSFLDGVGIGLGFHVSEAFGLLVAIAGATVMMEVSPMPLAP